MVEQPPHSPRSPGAIWTSVDSLSPTCSTPRLGAVYPNSSFDIPLFRELTATTEFTLLSGLPGVQIRRSRLVTPLKSSPGIGGHALPPYGIQRAHNGCLSEYKKSLDVPVLQTISTSLLGIPGRDWSLTDLPFSTLAVIIR